MVTTANSAARVGKPPPRSAIPLVTGDCHRFGGERTSDSARHTEEPCEQHWAATRPGTGTPPKQLVASLLETARRFIRARF
jgi:hypothetical protein